MENSNTVCSICYQSYDSTVRKPLVLPCSHSFCKECLETLAQSGERICPYCRQSWNNRRVCDLLCCIQLIPSVAANSNDTGTRCKDHDAGFTMWCNSCAQPICLNCLRLKHKTCDWVLIEEKYEGAVTRLQEVLLNKTQSLKTMDAVINKLLRARADLAEWKVKVEKELMGCPPTLEAARAKYPNTAELQQKTLALVGANVSPGVADNSSTLKFIPKANRGSPSLTVVKKVAVGIDLGLRHSRVSAVMDNGKVEIIPNEDGCKKTPNYVSFTDHEVLTGEAARRQALVDPRNAVYDIPRFLGRNTKGAIPGSDIKAFPFEVLEHNATLQIRVQHKGMRKVFTAQRMVSYLLKGLKSAAEEYLGCEVTDAVINVPAGFDQSQLDAVRVAGMMAGLNVLDVVGEAASAVAAYGLEKTGPGTTSSSSILVYCFGAACINASIFAVTGDACVLKASADNTHLGGDLFTQRLLDHCVKMVIDRFSNDLSTDPHSLEKLRDKCKAAKRKLSRSPKASVVIEDVSRGHDFTTCFTRSQFEDMCCDLFQQVLEPVSRALQSSGLSTVSEVVLVGGAALMPRVQDELKAFFSGKELIKSQHPSEVGAFGAAVKAEAECRDKSIISLYQ